MQKKILIAIDGSIYSSNSLNYLCHLFHDQKDVCFHLLGLISSASLPTGHELLDAGQLLLGEAEDAAGALLLELLDPIENAAQAHAQTHQQISRLAVELGGE